MTRRFFLGGAAAFACGPFGVFAAGTDRKEAPSAGRARVWEKPDGTATDTVMVRRLYLDLAGRLPTKDEAQAYAFSADPDKRAKLVDDLLGSKSFADYWTMRFCDLLRVKSEFPINLWPNAVYVYHARIHAFVEKDEAWDAFGRALLTSQGSDFRDAEVNFFRATDRRNPEGWAEAVAQTFWAIPPDRLPAERRAGLAQAFANLKIKDTREWKEEIVYVDGVDRRGELCDSLFVAHRSETAAAFRKTVCAWIFGPDAPCRPGPESFHLKEVLRTVVLSDDYARGSVTGGFPARRLDAEVLDDAICTLSGSGRDLQSPAPEPFTFLPPDRPTICVEDGSISNGFLSLFGRPARDTGLFDERGLDVTAKQRLYLFNSGKLHRQLGAIVAPPTPKDGPVNPIHRLPFPKRVDDLYWRLLAREPSPRERQLIVGLWQKRGGGRKAKVRPFDLLRDVAWCLVNSKEFLFRV
ncbi:MAG: DUF1549 domain-containing protein [Kiritimatiellia bacterium]